MYIFDSLRFSTTLFPSLHFRLCFFNSLFSFFLYTFISIFLYNSLYSSPSYSDLSVQFSFIIYISFIPYISTDIFFCFTSSSTPFLLIPFFTILFILHTSTHIFLFDSLLFSAFLWISFLLFPFALTFYSHRLLPFSFIICISVYTE